MKKQIENMSASVHARLLKQAKQDQRPFGELLQYFAMDRFLYRWTMSPHAQNFILKGALMLHVWETVASRSTRDIDMLASNSSNSLDSMIGVVRDVIAVEVEQDGLTFNGESLKAERINEDADYQGVRVRFIGNLGNARIHMQVDFGFGDVIYPGPENLKLPSMFGFPTAHMLCYSRESVLAEKFQAMIFLGDANSRMKDFHDIYTLSRQFDFNGETLAKAMQLTFNNRETEIAFEVNSFTKEFIELKEGQWHAYRKQLGQDHAPENFEEVIASVRDFFWPVSTAIATRKNMPNQWIAPGPWQ